MEISKQNPLIRLFRMRGMGQVLTVTAGLILLCFVFSRMNGNFLSGGNLLNLSRQIAPYVIIGISQSYVLITANIDLSIGSVIGMSMMMSATMMSKGMSPFAAILFTLAACLGVGLANGVLVARFKLPPFIATLGTMTIARGIAQYANHGRNTDLIGPHAEGFSQFFYYGNILGIFNAFWIALVLWSVFNFILSRTKTGRHIYAVGSNVDAAKMSGVSVTKTTIKVYLVSAFCACVVGFIYCAQAKIGTMEAGAMHELYAVAASVIGGISPLGGQGILLGTVVGAAVWAVMQNGLSLIGAPVALRNISVGIIVVISVLADVLIRLRKD
jgi:ribose transport system permease protein